MAKREREPSKRAVKAALLLESGKAKSRQQAMQIAGYAKHTARSPSQNGLTLERLERIARQRARGLKSQVPQAEAVLKQELADPDNPARGQLALALLKLAESLPDDNSDTLLTAVRGSVGLRIVRLNAFLRGLRLNASSAMLEAVQARLDGLIEQRDRLRE